MLDINVWRKSITIKSKFTKVYHKECEGCSYLKKSYMCLLDDPRFLNESLKIGSFICPCIECLVKCVCIDPCSPFSAFVGNYINHGPHTGSPVDYKLFGFQPSSGGSSGPSISSSSKSPRWVAISKKHRNRNQNKQHIKSKCNIKLKDISYSHKRKM